MAAVLHPIDVPIDRPTLRLVQGGAVRTARPVWQRYQAALFVLALVLSAAAAVAVGRGAFGAAAPAPGGVAAADAVMTEVAVVEAGDTLWTIARRLQPSGDIRPLVDRLISANPAVLQPGQAVLLPS